MRERETVISREGQDGESDGFVWFSSYCFLLATMCVHACIRICWPGLALPPCGGRLTDGRTESDLLKGIYGRGGGGRARPVCHLHTQGGMAASGACRLVKRIAGHRAACHADAVQPCTCTHGEKKKKLEPTPGPLLLACLLSPLLINPRSTDGRNDRVRRSRNQLDETLLLFRLRQAGLLHGDPIDLIVTHGLESGAHTRIYTMFPL
jgi:hypothetical protein